MLKKYLIGGPLRLTQDDLAKAMGVSRFTINQIMNGRRSVTAEMALRLGRVTSTTPELWLNLQRDMDLFEAQRAIGDVVAALPVVRLPKKESDLFVDAD